MIQKIHQWENCSESSVLFKNVARQVEHEMQHERLQPDEMRELSHTESHSVHNELVTLDKSSVEDSDDESMTESMKDFIVPDDESEEEDSEASFKPLKEEEEASQTSSDEKSDLDDHSELDAKSDLEERSELDENEFMNVDEGDADNEADLFFAAANDQLNAVNQDSQVTFEN